MCGPTEAGRPPALYVLDLVSGSTQRVADEASDGRSPSWSPDGESLSYQVEVDIGPAPVAATELWVYSLAAGTRRQLDQPHYFEGSPVWEPDGSPVVYVVGSWQHSNGPVDTYRVPLDGSGGSVWRPGIEAVAPGPDGRWLAVREAPGRKTTPVFYLLEADGSVEPLSRGPSGIALPMEWLPVGWLDTDPVVWRQTEPPGSYSAGRGEVWAMGKPPRLLASDVPRVDVRLGNVALSCSRLLYVDEWRGGEVWLVDLSTGQKSRLAVPGHRPVSLRPGK